VNTRPQQLIDETERRAGVCMHVTSLPGPYGIGEMGDAALAFIDAIARMGLGVWQFLPLGPTGYGDSPYQPLSTFAGNEMLIDMATLIRDGFVSSTDADALLGLAADAVDFGNLIPRKRSLLAHAAARFAAQADATRKADFDRFLDAHDAAWLHDYAVFRILKSMHGERAWTEWAPGYVHRETAVLRRVEASAGHEIERIKVLQYLFDRQIGRLLDHARERRVLLMSDMPFCIALDSADAWAGRDLVRLDDDGRPERVAGVPPDYFSADGQLWGNPVYDWQEHAATNYRWWIRRLQRNADQSDLVRIDHFRGFDAFWSIPAEATTAREGRWEEGPGEALFAALEASFGHLPIVAEDLGVITPSVEALRDRYGIPGMKVLQFEVADPDFDPSDIGPSSVCYTGTHDNDTTIGWFRGGPADTRSAAEIRATRETVLALTGGRAETVHTDLIRLACSTGAWLAIAPMQDYLGLGSAARMNVPGTSAGNWRWRMTAGQLTPARMDSVAGLVADTGRERRP